MDYSIKAACALLDVRADTLRKWERRYGLVKPRRKGNSYRGYSDADLKRLALFARARADGMPGPEAARKALAASKAPAEVRDAALERAAQAAIDGLDRERLAAVCAQAEAKFGKCGALEKLWIPLLSRLGERAMAVKGLEIAKEHFAVAVLRERILRRGPERGSPVVALASPEGELHEIGMLALAQELERRRLPFLYFGPNLPVDSLCAALTRTGIPRVILCLSLRLPRPELKAVIRKVKQKNPGVTVLIGGPASLTHANYISELGGVFLGAHLELGADKLVRSIQEAR